MKSFKLTLPERILMLFAGLMISLPLILKHYHPIPDAAYGFMIGIGIGLEITVLIKLKRKKSKLAGD
jgi:hypothetical protein